MKSVLLKSASVFILTMMSLTARADEAALQALSQLLSGHQQLSADFVQITQADSSVEPFKVEGNMVLKRPDRFRWLSLPPQEQLILGDGKTLWIYDIDLEQVTIHTMKNQFQDSPAILLSGDVNKIGSRYLVERVVDDLFLLTPKNDNDSLAAIEIRFQDGLISQLRFEDYLEQVTVIEFSNHDIRSRWPDRDFRLKVPAGVDVMDQRE